MTAGEKILLGLTCHEKHDCDKCPYKNEPDPMLDPRIDPDYNRRIIDNVRKCRDDLIADICKLNIPALPVQDKTPRFSMDWEYHDWLCPTCNAFVAWECNVKNIPDRCGKCGQKLSKEVTVINYLEDEGR